MTLTKDPIAVAGRVLMTLPKEVTPDEGSPEYDGYFCLNTDEFNCTCRKRPWRFIHYSKKIIVWPEKDDEKLLNVAQKMKDLNLNPKIIDYKVMMGKAIPWDDIPNGDTIG